MRIISGTKANTFSSTGSDIIARALELREVGGFLVVGKRKESVQLNSDGPRQENGRTG